MEGVRQALPDDLARCAHLLREAAREALRLRGGAALLAGCDVPLDDLGALQGRLAARAGAPDGIVCAGTLDDAVVGVGGGRAVLRGTERVGVVDWCYVEPDARGVGVGEALLARLIDWFTSVGCVGVDAPALPGDRSTKQLYESAGLSARLLVLHRQLP